MEKKAKAEAKRVRRQQVREAKAANSGEKCETDGYADRGVLGED